MPASSAPNRYDDGSPSAPSSQPAAAVAAIRHVRRAAAAIRASCQRLRSGGDGLHQVADALLVEVRRHVRLADDPDEPLAVDHGQAAHLVVDHRAQRLLDRVVGADRHRLAIAGAEPTSSSASFLAASSAVSFSPMHSGSGVMISLAFLPAMSASLVVGLWL